MNLCHRELERVYHQYNKRWFDEALPEDVDCMFAPTEGCIGLVQQEEGGWILTIDPRYAIEGRMWRLTLLHEQTHLLRFPYLRHGRPFQWTMQELAKSGAFRLLW